MEIITIDVPELGNRSYLVHDGSAAVVIDPSRRTSEIIETAKKADVQIAAVFETHIHNDYVTGGLALAKELDVPYYVAADDAVNFERQPIKHEQTVCIGKLKITGLLSPGHTHHHMSYLVEPTDGAAALFSGGSLLYGAVGRPDLVSGEATKPLAAAQYRTAQFFAKRLAPETRLYPTHGFGSFCAATDTEHVSVSSLQEQLRSNHVFTSASEEEFVGELLAGLDDYPAYYAYMAPANLQGPLAPEQTAPKRLSASALQKALHTGAGIIDMRSRTAYAAAHARGTYNIELGNQLATYVGWLIAWDAPLILIAENAAGVTTAQEQLTLIGRDIVSGQASADDLLQSTSGHGSYAVSTFAGLARVLPDEHISVLDVRRNSEWQRGHIPGALHIPIHELHHKMADIPADTAVWVHCQSGFRAAIAASILSTHGRTITLIDDDYQHAGTAGLLPMSKQPFVDEVTEGRAQLIDVRDTSEWNAGRAEHALHMPLGKLLSGGTAALLNDKPLYVYCASGERSGMAEHYLKSLGFDATNIGGLAQWIAAGGSMHSDAADA